jgi:hypothetical protein
MKRVFLGRVFLFAAMSGCAACMGGDGFAPEALRRSDFRNQLVSTKTAAASESMTTPVLETGHKIRKPALGALFSAVIPGTGEAYAGSWLKGAIFLGAEIALWTGYRHFSDKGDEIDGVFHAYADQHWSEPRYWVMIAQQAKIQGVTESNYAGYMEPLREFERSAYSHSLHLNKDQQYYEMIGKYDQFSAGWDDDHGDGATVTPNRNTYLEMRNDSNMNFKRASACAMGVLANHVLSAFDAGWTVKVGNRRIESKLQSRLEPSEGMGMAVFSWEINW